jgi:hypothetical protein
MPRYWIRHAAQSAGIVAVGLLGGAGLHALGNQGSVPYLQNYLHNVGNLTTAICIIGGPAYFLAGIPRVIRQERAQRIHDNYRDAAEIDSQTDIYDAENDQDRVLAGHRPRRRH